MNAEIINHAAREAAYQALKDVPVEGTPLVVYNSKGRLLVITDSEQHGAALLEKFQQALTVSVLLINSTLERQQHLQLMVEPSTANIQLDGYLGNYRLSHSASDEAPNTDGYPKSFDMVLDCLGTSVARADKKPPGYFTLASGSFPDDALVEEITSLIGDFEKPRYLEYNADICAHSRSNQPGCRRCLDACPAEAISSIGELIEVNDALCHGFGVCATACPTGAIRYNYPSAMDSQARLRKLLSTYRQEGGDKPQLFILSESSAQALDIGNANQWHLPAAILPIVLEEQGSLGMEAWMQALAFGAASIALLIDRETPASVVAELEQQLSVAHKLLDAMSYPADAISMIRPDDITAEGLRGCQLHAHLRTGRIRRQADKRSALYFALDYLADQALSAPEQTALPQGALFGGLTIHAESCTLCMGCVSVCPSGALADGGDMPALKFYQNNCVQCGLCEVSCPESALKRRPEFLFDREKRRAVQVLNEEKPFHCIRCQKPFATASMIAQITRQLENHSMFQSVESLNRLKMCEDCRVIAMMSEDESSLL